MSDPGRRSLGPGRGDGPRRPVWMGWSLVVVVLAVASIAVAARASDRGVGVQVPPAIDIGPGISVHADPPVDTTMAQDTTSSTVPTSSTSSSTEAQVTPTTQTSRTTNPTVQQTTPVGGASATSRSSDQSGSSRDGEKEGGDPPATVAPDYPVITGTPTSQPAGGGSDS